MFYYITSRFYNIATVNRFMPLAVYGTALVLFKGLTRLILKVKLNETQIVIFSNNSQFICDFFSTLICLKYTHKIWKAVAAFKFFHFFAIVLVQEYPRKLTVTQTIACINDVHNVQK